MAKDKTDEGGLFNGHDPDEVAERLIEIFSDMPCDLSTGDIVPEEEQEEEWAEAQRLCDRFFAERGNRSAVHLNRKTLRVWLWVAVGRGRKLERQKAESE